MKKLIDKMFDKPFIIVPNRENIEREIIGILHLLRSLSFTVLVKNEFYATILFTNKQKYGISEYKHEFSLML